jgi:rod shape-determining protein MreC
MDYNHPPFFSKGVHPAVKFVLCLLLSVSLLLIDSHSNITSNVRIFIAQIMYPIQNILGIVPDALHTLNTYRRDKVDILAENKSLHEQLTHAAIAAHQAQKLSAENAQLQNMLDLKRTTVLNLIAAQILHANMGTFQQKVIIDKGIGHKLFVGQPVINEYGVLGQITRVFLNYAEVALLYDKDIRIPVQNARNQIKAVTHGNQNNIQILFVPYQSDVKVGDTFVTSGLDGLFPSGLVVAQVTHVSNKSDNGFLKIDAKSAATDISSNKHYVMMLGKNAAVQSMQQESIFLNASPLPSSSTISKSTSKSIAEKTLTNTPTKIPASKNKL